MADAERTAREYIERFIRYGFYRPTEVERIVGEDVLAGEVPRTQIREMVKAEVARQKAEQESWPQVTDCDRLDQAFAALRSEGILTIHNAGMTPSEGIGEVSEQYHEAGGAESGIVGYCFYHRQDMEYALKHHKLGLAYGDIDGDDRRGCRSANASATRWRRWVCVWPGPARSRTSWRSRGSAGSGGARQVEAGAPPDGPHE